MCLDPSTLGSSRWDCAIAPLVPSAGLKHEQSRNPRGLGDAGDGKCDGL